MANKLSKPALAFIIFLFSDSFCLAQDINDLAQQATALNELAPGYGEMVPTPIAALPSDGAVKMTGIVSDLEPQKAFRLSDETGSIGVEMASQVALREGQRVTVVGVVDDRGLEKQVAARRIMLASNQQTAH